MRVCQFVTGFGTGGTELQVQGLAQCFDPERFILSFGCLSALRATEIDCGGRVWPVSEFPLNRFASVAAGVQMLRLARALRSTRTEVLHSYNFYSNVFSIPAARLAGVPCVVASIRDMGVYLTPMQARLQRWVCRLADRVVVNADAIRTKLVDEGYEPTKIRVIRNGVRSPEPGKARSRRDVRAELGIPSEAKVVLMVSRLNPQKGIETLIEASARVSERLPDVWFLAVGGAVLQSADDAAHYMQGLVSKVREQGMRDRFLFTGMRRDVPDLYAAADMAVLPSMSEGLPNAVIEAMAVGLPVVATRVGGIPELIVHGRSGLLVSAGDVDALAEGITRVLSHPEWARCLGDAARLRIRTGFSFEKMFRETEALYRAILPSKADGERGARVWRRRT